MASNQNDLALIVPLWNEYSRGSFIYLKLLPEISGVDIIFVNDGSTDQTKEELEKLFPKSNIQVIHQTRNFGKSRAIQEGIKKAVELNSYKFIGFLDGDGAFSISEVKRYIQLASSILSDNHYQALCSSRVALSGHNIQRSSYRHLAGRAIRTIIDMKHKKLPYDTQSGFKIFLNNEYFQTSVYEKFQTKWFVDLEILLKLKLKDSDYKIWEEPLFEWTDISNSSISWKSVPRIACEVIYIMRLKSS